MLLSLSLSMDTFREQEYDQNCKSDAHYKYLYHKLLIKNRGNIVCQI